MPAGAGKWMPALADLKGCDGKDVRHAHARLRRPLDAHIPPDHPARLTRPNLRYAARRAVRKYLLGVHLFLPLLARAGTTSCQHCLVLSGPGNPVSDASVWLKRVR